MRRCLPFFLLVLLLLGGQALASTLVLRPLESGQRAEGHLAYLRDPAGGLTLSDVRGREFQPLADEAGFGFTRDAIWLRLTVQAPAAGEWWLETGLVSLDDIRVYYDEDDDEDGESGWIEQRAGDHYPFAQRFVPHRLFVFPLRLPSAKPHTVYLRIRTDDSLTVPIRVWEPAAFQDRRMQENLVLGIGYGIVLAMLIYNAFLWGALRESIYGAYLLAMLTSLLTALELNGQAFQYLWPNNVWLADHQHVLIPAFHFLALSHWIRTFLDTRQRTPWMDRGLLAVMAVAVAMIGLSLTGHYTLGNRIAFVDSFPLIFLSIAASARVAWQGYRPAILFLAAQFFPMFGALLTVLRMLGKVPDTPWTEHGIQIGICVEVLLFSLALAKRIDVLRQEKHDALKRAETDPLTGLLNRAGFLQRLETRLAGGDEPVALLLIDLDGFKPVNDTLGHAAGDVVLQQVAERLRHNVRAGADLVGRLGGDEFVAALVGVRSQDHADAVAAKIVNALELPVATEAGDAAVGASVGIALSSEHGRDAHELMATADAAMYAAKRAGRKQYLLAPFPPR